VTNFLASALQYKKLGLSPIPLRPGTKQPIHEGHTEDTVYRRGPWDTHNSSWHNFNYDGPELSKYFQHGENLGIRLDGDFVDIDLDGDFTADLLPFIFPGAITFGHGGKTTHAILFLEPGETGAYHNLSLSQAETTELAKYGRSEPTAKNTIIEIRVGRDKQSMFPPSVHPSGEPLAWIKCDPEKDFPLAKRYKFADILKGVGIIATLSVIVRGYPHSSRNFFDGKIAGIFARSSATSEEIADYISLVQAFAVDREYAHARKGEAKHHAKHLKSAVEAKTEGQADKTRVPGLKALCGPNGLNIPSLIPTFFAWLHPGEAGYADDGPILAMNDEWAYLESVGDFYNIRLKTVCNYSTFKHATANQFHFVSTTSEAGNVSTKRVNTGKAWYESAERRVHRGLAFAPNEDLITEDNDLNLFTGFPYEGKPGDVTPFLNLVKRIAGTDTRGAEALLDWCAHKVQHPEIKIFSYLWLWSEMNGTGKGLFVETLAELFKPYSSAVTSEMLHDKNNSYLASMLFTYCDEATIGDRRETVEKINAATTQDVIWLQDKYVKRYSVKNLCEYCQTTNNSAEMLLKTHDRRAFVLHSLETPIGAEAGTAYKKWLMEEGKFYVKDFLMKRDVSQFNPKAAAYVSATKKEILFEQDEIAQYVADRIIFDANEAILASTLYLDYNNAEARMGWALSSGIKRTLTLTNFGTKLAAHMHARFPGGEVIKGKSSGLMIWRGFRLRTEDDTELGFAEDEPIDLIDEKFSRKALKNDPTRVANGSKIKY
jgi:Family of unknown function (DUF5906)/Bifunctional DNA primase/polymerase, N-terminal